MSPEQNKAIVIEIWEQMARGETTALSDAMTDDFTWVFPGVWSWAGEWGPKDVALSQMLRPLMQQFASYASRAELVLADGDKVVVQARAEATTLRGDRYRIRSPASSCACATARLPSSSSIATPRWSSASCTHPHDATDRSRPRPGRPTEISDCHEAGSIQHQHGCGRINMGAAAGPEQILAVVHAAEEAGFESVWAGEHVVLPDPQTPTSPLSPKAPVLDSVATLAWIAAHTRTLRLATGIAILPQHNPCVLAKEIATLDALSGGRAILGIGSGYLEPEFAALGANFAERGAVTDEYLDAIDHLWYDERPAYHGRFIIRRHRRLSATDPDARPDRRGRQQSASVQTRRYPRHRLVRILAHTRGDRHLPRRATRRSRSPPAARNARRAGDHSHTPHTPNTPSPREPDTPERRSVRRARRTPAGAMAARHSRWRDRRDRAIPESHSRAMKPARGANNAIHDGNVDRGAWRAIRRVSSRPRVVRQGERLVGWASRQRIGVREPQRLLEEQRQLMCRASVWGPRSRLWRVRVSVLQSEPGTPEQRSMTASLTARSERPPTSRGRMAFTSAEHRVWWLVLGLGVGILVLGLLSTGRSAWTPAGGRRRCSRRWAGARIFEPPPSAADDRRRGADLGVVVIQGETQLTPPQLLCTSGQLREFRTLALSDRGCTPVMAAACTASASRARGCWSRRPPRRRGEL